MMPRTVRATVVLIACAVALGCGGARKPSDLHGPWKVDIERSAAQIRESEVVKWAPKGKEQEAEEVGRNLLEAMTYVFSENKLTIKMMVMGTENADEKEMKYVSTQGNEWSIQILDKGSKPETTILTWIDADHISLLKQGEKKEQALFLKRSK